MAVKPGEIVFAMIPDPEGNRCRDKHPVMVLRASSESPNVWVVGITSEFNEPPPKHWLRLPWHPQGHATTGLYLDSVLKTNWIHRKAAADLSPPIGVVPAELFLLASDLIWAAVERAAAKGGSLGRGKT